jgi:hypothetical protein
MMDKHPLPWKFVKWEGAEVAGDVFDASGAIVVHTIPEDEAARILAVTNKVPALVEACEAWVKYMAELERDTEPGDPISLVRARVHGARIEQTRTALAAFKTP